MAIRRVAVDGEEGFSVSLGEAHLVLRKGDRHVRMSLPRISSACWERRYRYGRPLLWMGIVLLLALGLGVVLLLLYYFSGYMALVIIYRKREYALSGERDELERILRHIRRTRAGAADSSE